MGRFPRKDKFYLKAKDEGFRARSAYKLLEIQKRFQLIKSGDRVLDLGCSPGSFIQVIHRIVGEKGFIVGIDLLETESFPSSNVVIRKGDVCEIDIKSIMEEYGIPSFDIITSDISPNISGIREVDEENRKRVYESIKKITVAGLKTGGHLIMKCFFTESFIPIKNDLKNMFKRVVVFKPQASRKISPEVYLIGMSLKKS
ncbi:MAG: RlmE family RNA methyltransferase [Deltaproteobacteria bacterium]|nr:RlmE family RNA methyltransferase [Deltaproteobacteria bacterium]